MISGVIRTRDNDHLSHFTPPPKHINCVDDLSLMFSRHKLKRGTRNKERQIQINLSVKHDIGKFKIEFKLFFCLNKN